MRHISITGPDGTTVQLEGQKGLYAETALDLRGAKPSYTLTGRGLTGMTDSSRETTLEVKALGHEGRQTLDGLVERGHAHAEQGKPCTVDVDGWKQTAYIPNVAAKAVDPIITTASLTLCLLEGIWRKPSTTILSGASANGGVDYPHDYPHDYAPPTDSRPISLPVGGMSALAGIVFQGPATSPYLRVGRNIYQVKASVPAGGLITVDPITRSVTVTQPDGTVTDAFAQAVRGSGLGSENYIFEPLPEGTVMASVSGCALAQLTVWERRLTPPWDTDGTPSSVDEQTPVRVGYGAEPQLASMATVHWSDWQTTTEPITWTNIPDTNQAGAVLTATGMCAGLIVTQRILVSDNLLTGPGFETMIQYPTWGTNDNWHEQADGGQQYVGSANDTGMKGYMWGGNIDDFHGPITNMLLQPGDYTLSIPILSAENISDISMNYGLTTDNQTWNLVMETGHTWSDPLPAAMMISFHVDEPANFGCFAHFTANANARVSLGKPELYQGVRGGVLTSDDLDLLKLDNLNLLGQSAFTNGPDYDSRWHQQNDGGWLYKNPADSGISEYAGRSFGGHLGGSKPDVDSRLLVPAGDYTLTIPVNQASGFPTKPAPHSIGLSYRLSSDGKSWDENVYRRMQWWEQPEQGSKLRMKVHVAQPSYFGFSLSFDAIPGMSFGLGKPQLMLGVFANAAGGGSSVPDLTGVSFIAGSALPDSWESGNATSESTPYDVTPANHLWAYKVTDGASLTASNIS